LVPSSFGLLNKRSDLLLGFSEKIVNCAAQKIALRNIKSRCEGCKALGTFSVYADLETAVSSDVLSTVH